MEVLNNQPAQIDPEGNLTFDTASFKTAAKNLRKPETRNVRILIIHDYQDATTQQLAYWHGFMVKDVVMAFESIGDSITEVEADKNMRELFLFDYETNLSSGRKIKKVKSLDKSSGSFPDTKEMAFLFESVVRYCAINMNYVIHLPSDFVDIDLNFDRKENSNLK
jgi:hypothetical protein